MTKTASAKRRRKAKAQNADNNLHQVGKKGAKRKKAKNQQNKQANPALPGNNGLPKQQGSGRKGKRQTSAKSNKAPGGKSPGAQKAEPQPAKILPGRWPKQHPPEPQEQLSDLQPRILEHPPAIIPPSDDQGHELGDEAIEAIEDHLVGSELPANDEGSDGTKSNPELGEASHQGDDDKGNLQESAELWENGSRLTENASLDMEFYEKFLALSQPLEDGFFQDEDASPDLQDVIVIDDDLGDAAVRSVDERLDAENTPEGTGQPGESLASENVQKEPDTTTGPFSEWPTAYLTNGKGVAKKQEAAAALPLQLQEVASIPIQSEFLDDIPGSKLCELRAPTDATAFGNEAALLRAVLYKNKSQHRRVIAFKHLQQVLKLTTAIETLRIGDLIRELQALHKPDLPSRAVRVPWGEAAVFLLHRFRSAALCCEVLVTAVRKAVQHLLAHLARAHFMKMYVALLAVLARLQVLTGSLMMSHTSNYNLLINGVERFPFRSTYGPLTGEGLPQMLAFQWKDSLPSLLPMPYDRGASIPDLVQSAAQSHQESHIPGSHENLDGVDVGLPLSAEEQLLLRARIEADRSSNIAAQPAKHPSKSKDRAATRLQQPLPSSNGGGAAVIDLIVAERTEPVPERQSFTSGSSLTPQIVKTALQKDEPETYDAMEERSQILPLSHALPAQPGVGALENLQSWGAQQNLPLPGSLPSLPPVLQEQQGDRRSLPDGHAHLQKHQTSSAAEPGLKLASFGELAAPTAPKMVNGKKAKMNRKQRAKQKDAQSLAQFRQSLHQASGEQSKEGEQAGAGPFSGVQISSFASMAKKQKTQVGIAGSGQTKPLTAASANFVKPVPDPAPSYQHQPSGLAQAAEPQEDSQAHGKSDYPCTHGAIIPPSPEMPAGTGEQGQGDCFSPLVMAHPSDQGAYFQRLIEQERAELMLDQKANTAALRTEPDTRNIQERDLPHDEVKDKGERPVSPLVSFFPTTQIGTLPSPSASMVKRKASSIPGLADAGDDDSAAQKVEKADAGDFPKSASSILKASPASGGTAGKRTVTKRTTALQNSSSDFMRDSRALEKTAEPSKPVSNAPSSMQDGTGPLSDAASGELVNHPVKHSNMSLLIPSSSNLTNSSGAALPLASSKERSSQGEGGWLGDPFGPSESLGPIEDDAGIQSQSKSPCSGERPVRIIMPSPSSINNGGTVYSPGTINSTRKRKRQRKTGETKPSNPEPAPKQAAWMHLLDL